MEIVQLRFKYTQSEYVRAERQYLIANKTIRRYDAFLVMVFLVFSIGNLLFSAFSTFSFLLLGLVLTVTAVGSFLYFLMPILRFKQTAKYHEEYNLTFSKETIRFETQSIESELKWSIYSEIWENDDFYFLIQGPRMYALIPKRAFINENQKHIFAEIAQLNLKTIKLI